MASKVNKLEFTMKIGEEYRKVRLYKSRDYFFVYEKNLAKLLYKEKYEDQGEASALRQLRKVFDYEIISDKEGNIKVSSISLRNDRSNITRWKREAINYMRALASVGDKKKFNVRPEPVMVQYPVGNKARMEEDVIVIEPEHRTEVSVTSVIPWVISALAITTLLGVLYVQA